MQTAGRERYAIVHSMKQMITEANPLYSSARFCSLETPFLQQSLDHSFPSVLHPHPDHRCAAFPLDLSYAEQRHSHRAIEHDKSQNQSISIDRRGIIQGEEKRDGKESTPNVWGGEENLVDFRFKSALDLELHESELLDCSDENLYKRLSERELNKNVTSLKEQPENEMKSKLLKNLEQDFHELESVYTTGMQQPEPCVPKQVCEDIKKLPRLNNKRKRKEMHYREMDFLKTFFENMVKKLLESQEMLQDRFLEEIKRRDRRQMEREEAWKQQQMARYNKESEIRAKEQTLALAREAAIVSFIEKICGQVTQNPHYPSSRASKFQNQVTSAAADNEESDLNCQSWPDHEVQALLNVRNATEQRFQASASKVGLSDEILFGISALGFTNCSTISFKENFENINKYMERNTENRKMPRKTKACSSLQQTYKSEDKNSLDSEEDNRTEEYKALSDTLLGPECQNADMKSTRKAMADKPKADGLEEEEEPAEFSKSGESLRLSKQRNSQSAMHEPSQSPTTQHGLITLLDNLTAELSQDYCTSKHTT